MDPLSVDPSALAPFSENELARLAKAVSDAKPEARTTALQADEVGAKAVKAVGDARALIALLHAVWGEGNDVVSSADDQSEDDQTARKAA